MCTGMAALNGGLGSGGLSNGSGSAMEALTQAAYSGIQQYAAAALPSLYSQSLLSQQNVSAACSQREGEHMKDLSFEQLFRLGDCQPLCKIKLLVYASRVSS